MQFPNEYITPRFPDPIRALICDYAAVWCLLDWINSEILDWKSLALNPNAIDHMLANPRDAQWGSASTNPNAFYILRDELKTLVDWHDLAENSNPDAIAYAIDNIDTCIRQKGVHLLSRSPHAMPWLIAHPEYINIFQLSMNPHDDAIPIIRANLNNGINWYLLSANPNPAAVEIVADNWDSANAYGLCSNPNANLDMIKKHPDFSTHPDSPPSANWYALCKIERRDIVEFILAHPDKIEWEPFSGNPLAFDYLNMNRGSINVRGLSRNPRIFEPRRPKGVYDLL